MSVMVNNDPWRRGEACLALGERVRTYEGEARLAPTPSRPVIQ